MTAFKSPAFKSMLDTLREQVGEEEADRIVEKIKADVEAEAGRRWNDSELWWSKETHAIFQRMREKAQLLRDAEWQKAWSGPDVNPSFGPRTPEELRTFRVESERVHAAVREYMSTRTAPESPCTCAEIQRKDPLRHFRECPLREDLPEAPIPMIMYCPMCAARHIDDGEFAKTLHHTHACQDCGHVWRPAVVATVGVQFLPGFKNEEET